MDEVSPNEKIFWTTKTEGFIWSDDQKLRTIMLLEGTGWSIELDSAETMPLIINQNVNCQAGTRRRFISDGSSGIKFKVQTK